MRSKRTALLLALMVVAVVVFGPGAGASGPAATASAGAGSNPEGAAYARLPMRFERNRGQTDKRAQFITRGPGYTLFLTKSEAVFSLAGARAAATHARTSCGCASRPRRGPLPWRARACPA